MPLLFAMISEETITRKTTEKSKKKNAYVD
jgi:hypothetical protein